MDAPRKYTQYHLTSFPAEKLRVRELRDTIL
jgi:hypothetical protein